MFCGILPWNWFSTSLNEAAGSLIAGGNLIKKVLFPAEVLPIVSVSARTWCTSSWRCPLSGSPDRLPALARPGRPALVPGGRRRPADLHGRAGADAGRADRALPRHPRHPRERADVVVLRDADHLFLRSGESAAVQVVVQPQSVHPSRDLVPGDPVLQRPVRPLEVAAGAGGGVARACSPPATGCSTGCGIRSRRSCSAYVRHIDRHHAANVSKIYRRYSGRQFATLKSALLQRSILRDLQSERNVSGADRRLVHRADAAAPSASSAGTDRARARR